MRHITLLKEITAMQPVGQRIDSTTGEPQAGLHKAHHHPEVLQTPTPPTEPPNLYLLRTAVLHGMTVELYGHVETTEQEAMETLTHICEALSGKDFTLQLSQNWKVITRNVLPLSPS